MCSTSNARGGRPGGPRNERSGSGSASRPRDTTRSSFASWSRRTRWRTTRCWSDGSGGSVTREDERGSPGGLGGQLLTGRMGRHEPPTNRSFYLSMGASMLRFALIVALVVGGIALINQAFPEASEDTPVPRDTGIGTTDSPSPTSSPDGDDEPSKP